MQFVSLGAWCQVAYQLTRAFKGSFIPSAFDWTVAPLHSVQKIFDSNGESFGERVFVGEPSMSVECETYGILYHHEYRRDSNKVAIITEEQTATAKSKLRYKHKKMIASVAGSPDTVTFVRFGGAALPARAWPYSQDVAPVAAAVVNDMVCSIERAIGRGDFRLLFVTDPQVMRFSVTPRELDERVVSMNISSPAQRTWMGHDADWDVLLARYMDGRL